MSASTRTVQRSIGTDRLGTVLLATALVIVTVVALALSQLATTKVQTAAPATGSAPVFVDHGSRDEIGPGAATLPAAGSTPVFSDHGLHSRLLRSPIGTGVTGTSGSNGPRLRPQ
jgi:integral membrane sensor domain MASE1